MDVGFGVGDGGGEDEVRGCGDVEEGEGGGVAD